MIPSAFNREDVAQLERSSDGHASQRAEQMIPEVGPFGKPPLDQHLCKLTLDDPDEVRAHAVLDPRHHPLEGDRTLDMALPRRYGTAASRRASNGRRVGARS